MKHLIASSVILCAALSALASSQQVDPRVERIHQKWVFADTHAHPSRFHRANVPRIMDDELDRYRHSLVDVLVANVSSDAIYSGNYELPDGTKIPPREHHPAPGEPFAFTLDRFERILRTVEDGRAVLASSPAAVLEAKGKGQLSIIAALEGADGLESKIDNLRTLHQKGLRLLQLVHFRANELGFIQTYPYTPGGLTAFGKEVVRECNRLGILIDLAHANTQTIMDTVAASTDPVIFSHTGAKALQPDVDRNVTDEEIKAIAAKGGLIGIWPDGSELPKMADMVRHIDHVKQLAGVDHVCIGSDLRGMSSYTEGFGEEANFLAIAEGLLAAGYSEDDVGKVMGGNFMNLWTKVYKGQ